MKQPHAMTEPLLMGFMIGDMLVGYSFGTSKNEASAVSLAQPLENP